MLAVDKPNPSIDETEMAAVRKRLTTAGLGLWQEAEASAGLAHDGETRHAQAIASTEASATPNETRIVERVQARLRAMDLWSADDVRDFLTEEGVPDTLAIRRRYASRCVNGIRAKRSAGKTYTRHGSRSGRLIELWENLPLDTPTERG